MSNWLEVWKDLQKKTGSRLHEEMIQFPENGAHFEFTEHLPFSKIPMKIWKENLIFFADFKSEWRYETSTWSLFLSFKFSQSRLPHKFQIAAKHRYLQFSFYFLIPCSWIFMVQFSASKSVNKTSSYQESASLTQNRLKIIFWGGNDIRRTEIQAMTFLTISVQFAWIFLLTSKLIPIFHSIGLGEIIRIWLGC